jgi:hypothetical protein
MGTGNAPFDSRCTGFGACFGRGERPHGSNRHAGMYVEGPELTE